MTSHPGTAGYAAAAERTAEALCSITFDDVHGCVAHLLPAAPGRALDIGAGDGRDAAELAARGFDVVAVEPLAEHRALARRRYPDAPVRWMDDALPTLGRLRAEGIRFDLILITAVWMHLDRDERTEAMDAVAQLLAADGLATITLRRGPVPSGKRMFDVSAEETVRLAERSGLQTAGAPFDHPSALPRGDVWWTRVNLTRPERAAQMRSK